MVGTKKLKLLSSNLLRILLVIDTKESSSSKKILQTTNTLGTIISVQLKYRQEKSTCVVVILI